MPQIYGFTQSQAVEKEVIASVDKEIQTDFPTAEMHFRGEWISDTIYDFADIVRRNDSLYLSAKSINRSTDFAVENWIAICAAKKNIEQKKSEFLVNYEQEFEHKIQINASSNEIHQFVQILIPCKLVVNYFQKSFAQGEQAVEEVKTGKVRKSSTKSNGKKVTITNFEISVCTDVQQHRTIVNSTFSGETIAHEFCPKGSDSLILHKLVDSNSELILTKIADQPQFELCWKKSVVLEKDNRVVSLFIEPPRTIFD
jgi:hypothetical protein